MKNFLLLLGILFLHFSISAQQTKIHWDEWGVPHISSDNMEELFFAQGWAQMNNHANHILQLYSHSRGKAAEYWGGDKLQNDMIIHSLAFPGLADEWLTQMDPESKLIFNSFVKGMNAYAENNPEAILEENRKILPLSVKDVIMHSMFVVFTRFVAGQELRITQQWPDMGSNAYAIGPSRTESGNAMLVQNPHLPWFGEFLFFESHFLYEDNNIYGANLVGLPGIAIGFNNNLGWTHTDNVIDNSDLFEIPLKDDGYLVDGEKRDFEKRMVNLKVKQEDGSLATHQIPVVKTIYGPVVKKSEDKVLSLRVAGIDRPDMILQWWKMAQSQSFSEFEGALKMQQIPFWNVMYADKAGNIFYLFNGLIPQRTKGDWNYWSSIVDGSDSENLWTKFHAYKELPKVKNPETGWLQNANDPPWTSTLPRAINSEDYPPYFSPDRMSFRPQRSARMLMEDEKISFEELVDYKLSTHLEFADRILDDLFAAIEENPSPLLTEAKNVLEDWDRSADADSQGTLLFYNWARKFNVWNTSNYIKGWDKKDPGDTPDGLADPEKALNLLEEAAKEIKNNYGKLDVEWGEYYKIRKGEEILPGHGMNGSLGIFRVAWSDGPEGTSEYISGGDSWVGIIEFSKVPHAKVLLSYGNATQKNSPHNGDQLQLFSEKRFRDAYFTREAVELHSKKTLFLKDESFVTGNDN
ncbi:acylase [Gramella sp. BOM4]|nr:acylase [Christiangramia bathymodioli]